MQTTIGKGQGSIDRFLNKCQGDYCIPPKARELYAQCLNPKCRCSESLYFTEGINGIEIENQSRYFTFHGSVYHRCNGATWPCKVIRW